MLTLREILIEAVFGVVEQCSVDCLLPGPTGNLRVCSGVALAVWPQLIDDGRTQLVNIAPTNMLS